MTSRYKTDPVFREKVLASSRSRYLRLKAQKLAQQSNENSIESSSVGSEPQVVNEPSIDSASIEVIDTISVPSQNDYESRINELEKQITLLKNNNYSLVKMMHDFFGKMLIEQNQTRDLTEAVIDEILDSSENLSNESKKKYKKNVNLIKQQLGYNKPDYNFIRDASSVIDLVQKSDYTESTKSNRLSVLLHISKALSLSVSNSYEESHNKMVEMRDRERNKNRATEKDFDWSLLQEKYTENKHLLQGDLKLVAALYIERAPLRTEYCRNLMITDDESKYKNVIIYDGKDLRMRLTDFKNVKKFPNNEYRYIFQEGNLKTLILEKMREIGMDKPIFSVQSKAFRGRIKDVLKIIMGIDSGVYQLRHSYETFIQQQPGYFTMSMEEREKLHYDVLHSFGTAMQYRRIKEDSTESEED